MKKETSIKFLVKYSTISVLALLSPVFAIERPTPAAQPEENLTPALPDDGVAKAIPIPLAQPVDTAFLGVFGEPISKALASHLGLAEGTGIELEIVAPNSPALKAGLQKHDIITSINGKNISTIEDLQAAIAEKKPGDEVALNYISKGKPLTLNLTLGARSIPRVDAGQVPQQNQERRADLGKRALPEEFLNKFPKDDREKLMKLFSGNLEGLDLQELQQGMNKLDGFDQNFQPQGLNPEMNKDLKLKGAFQSRVKMLDQHGSITLETTKDGKLIELLDKQGNLQYRGPYNNQADKMNVPEDLRERVENLNIDNGIGFRLNPNLDAHEMRMRDLKKLMEMQQMQNDLMQQFQFPDLANKKGLNMLNLKIDGHSMSSTRTDPSTGNRFTLKKEGKSKQVEIYDPRGELLYNGPYNSDIDKASVPEEFRNFIESIDIQSPVKGGNKIELKLGQ
jgi:hypothetical protein